MTTFKQKIFFGAVVLAGLVAAIFFMFAPGIAESGMNKVRPNALDVSPQTQKLHDSLRIADLHADSLLWNRDLLKRGSRGHVDIPRLLAGNVGLQVFTTVTKSPDGLNNLRNEAETRDNITLLAIAQRWPISSWTSLTARALHQGRRLHEFAQASGGQLVIIKNKTDLVTLLAQRENGQLLVGGVLGTEGSHALDGNLDNVQRLFDAGFRLMSLQHFFDNRLGGSLHGVSKLGLTEFGRNVVRKIESLQVMLDVSHSSPQVVRDTLAIAKRPLVVSHTGIHSHCSTPRNIEDELMLQIAATGGLIGVGYWDSAACDISPAGVAKSIVAAVELVGADHVALGSDFDGAVTTGFDSAELAQLTQALLDAGLDREVIRKVMGENQLAFFAKYLPE
ncbi:MAG: dipeptidase [Gammaproteobacteria bacterium]